MERDTSELGPETKHDLVQEVEDYLRPSPGAIVLGAAVYPPGANEIFSPDYRAELPPGHPVRVAAEERGEIREYGSAASLATMAAANKAC